MVVSGNCDSEFNVWGSCGFVAETLRYAKMGHENLFIGRAFQRVRNKIPKPIRASQSGHHVT